MAREGPFFGETGTRKPRPSFAAWDDNSPLAQTMDEMAASMGKDNASKAVASIGEAIAAVASRTGAQISGRDSSLLSQVLGSLSPSERASLATGGNSAVIAKVNALVEHQAQLSMQAKTAFNAHGTTGSDAAPEGVGRKGGPQDALGRQLREGTFGQYADRDGKSSARFAEANLPGASMPGGADIRGISAANYYTSPITRALVGMGMNDNTFTHLRDQGFNRTHIERAAKDAGSLGFSVNDKRAVKNHAVIRRDGNNPDETMRRMKDFQGDLRKSDEFRKAVGEHDAAKTDADREKALQRINEIADKIAGKKGGVTEDQKRQRSQAVQEAIGEIRKDVVKQEVKGAIDAAPASNARTTATNRSDGSVVQGDKALMDALRNKSKPQQSAQPTVPAPSATPSQSTASPTAKPASPAPR
jgi:uncharacterized protein YnzC (UPF0291/DUF896 family)